MTGPAAEFADFQRNGKPDKVSCTYGGDTRSVSRVQAADTKCPPPRARAAAQLAHAKYAKVNSKE
jgi:hypothetical protein